MLFFSGCLLLFFFLILIFILYNRGGMNEVNFIINLQFYKECRECGIDIVWSRCFPFIKMGLNFIEKNLSDVIAYTDEWISLFTIEIESSVGQWNYFLIKTSKSRPNTESGDIRAIIFTLIILFIMIFFLSRVNFSLSSPFDDDPFLFNVGFLFCDLIQSLVISLDLFFSLAFQWFQFSHPHQVSELSFWF